METKRRQKVFGGVNHNIEFPTKNSVENFNYNGFGVESKKGFASFKVLSLVKWTNDPGIGRFLCDDHKERLIPSCQLTKEFLNDYPKQQKLNCFGKNANGILFGKPCKS